MRLSAVRVFKDEWQRSCAESGDQYRTRPPHKQDHPQEHQQPARDQQQRYPCPLEHGLQQPHRGPLWPRGPLCRLVQGCAYLPADALGMGGCRPADRPYSSTLATEHTKFILSPCEVHLNLHRNKRPRPRRAPARSVLCGCSCSGRSPAPRSSTARLSSRSAPPRYGLARLQGCAHRRVLCSAALGPMVGG